MDWLQPMRIFVAVVQHGSLSSAGRELGLSPASVSRHVSALEHNLGCRLINRSSRKLALTEAGQLYFSKVEQILQQVADANESVSQLQKVPRGTLRIHSRMLVGHLILVPALPAFLARYPDLKVDLLLSNHTVDLVERNIDVDIRIGKLVDSSLVAHRLAYAERILCAAPGYLERHPPLRAPGELARHDCLTYRINVGQTVWRFIDADDTKQEVPVTGSLQSDNGLALLNATLAGLGIALMPDWAVDEAIAQGRLRRLLPQFRISHIEFDNGVYAVFQRSHTSAKVRAFVDYLDGIFAARNPSAESQPTSRPPSTGRTTPVT